MCDTKIDDIFPIDLIDYCTDLKKLVSRLMWVKNGFRKLEHLKKIPQRNNDKRKKKLRPMLLNIWKKKKKGSVYPPCFQYLIDDELP